MSRGGAVGKAIAYGLADGGVGIRVPVGSRIVTSHRSDRLWGPPILLPEFKVAEAWSLPLTSIKCRGQDTWIYKPIPPYTFMACLIS
jgi:hypothetical protein